MTTIAQKVEMVFGARDSGASRTLDAIRAASDRAEKTASKLGANLLAFGAGFLTAGFAQKVVKYSVDVARAADKTSELGQRATDFGKAFDSFSSKFEEQFAKVLVQALPLLTRGFELLGAAIDFIIQKLKDFGLIAKDELEQTLDLMKQLESGDTFVRGGDREALSKAGARFRPVAGPGTPVLGEEVTNRFEVMDALAGRYQEMEKASKAIAEATAEAAANEERMASAAAQRSLNKDFQKRQEQEALAGYQKARDGSFLLGAQEAVDKLQASIMNLGDLGAASVDLLNQGLMGTADILVDSFRSTEDLGESFKQLGSDLLAQLAKMLVYQALLRGASGALGGIGFAHGGVMRSGGHGSDEPLRLSAYAYGGVARGPQIAVYGETSRPEAYVPLPDGRSIPVTMAASGGDTFNMYVSAIDARSFEQRLAAHPRIYTSAMRRGMSSNGGDRSAVRRAAR